MKIRWRRAWAMAALAIGVLVVAALMPLAWWQLQLAINAPRLAVSAGVDDQRAILAAVLPAYRTQGIPPPPPEPGRPPSPLRAKRMIVASQWQPMPPDFALSVDSYVRTGELEEGLGRGLLATGTGTAGLPADGMPDGVILKPRAEILAALEQPDWWDRFHRVFPDAAGFIELTRPVVSRDGRHALVYVGFRCGGLCGVGELHVLERQAGAWRIVSTLPLWVS